MGIRQTKTIKKIELMGKRILFFFLFVQLTVFGAEWDTLYITYSDSVKDIFETSVQQALSRGFISKDLKKKQSASLSFNGDSFDARIRLKGDWLDHVREDKWSLRVNLKEGNVYAARKFSLQFPETRGGENERIFHEELHKRDILTPYYTFVHVVVNKEYWGVFAFEEHFDESLLERNNRPSGPIIKFDEDGFWECQQMSARLGEKVCVEYPIFASSKIRPFGKKKIFRDSVQHMRFNNGRFILNNWKNGRINLDQLDLKRFAEYYSMCDAFGFYHGLQWHNQRFHFRVADGRLEPVAFDCFSEDNSLIGKDFLGRFDEHYSTVYFHEQWFNYHLFAFQEFIELYKESLQNYIDTKGWEIDGISEELRKQLENRADRIKLFIREEQALPSYYPYFDWKLDNPDLVKEYSVEFPNNPLPSVQLLAERNKDRLEVTNYHIRPIKIIGYSNDSGIVSLVESIQLEREEMFPFNWENPKKVIALTEFGDTLKCKVENTTSTIGLNEKAGDWEEYFTKCGETWCWRSDILILNKRIELPAGNSFVIDNLKLEFLDQGLIVCNGDLLLSDSQFKSNGESNVGFRMFGSVLEMNNIVFEDFSIPKSDGNSPIQVIGSVVNLFNVEFRNIDAEDAMNLVDCNVSMKDIRLFNCSSDGLDLDFSRGNMTEIKVFNCLGDGIDVSFSSLDMSEMEISHCRDKGVSVGERSKVVMTGMDISNCTFGIAVKDESVIHVEKSTILECSTQLTAFRKKAFFTVGGTVSISDSNIEVALDEYSNLDE